MSCIGWSAKQTKRYLQGLRENLSVSVKADEKHIRSCTTHTTSHNKTQPSSHPEEKYMCSHQKCCETIKTWRFFHTGSMSVVLTAVGAVRVLVSRFSQHSASELISTYPTLGSAHLNRLWIKTNDSETAMCVCCMPLVLLTWYTCPVSLKVEIKTHFRVILRLWFSL